MKERKLFYLFLGAIVNGLLFLVISDYYFWFLVVLAVGAIFCITIICADILGKTTMWKKALPILGIGVFSWLSGILAIIIRNFFLGYFSN
ncbi:MAG: hypothetical protein ACHQET_04400 [Chitinophagales bacterium]